MDSAQLFRDLTDICTVPPGSNTQSSVKTINHAQMWTILLDIAQNSIRTLGMYYPLIIAYVEKFPSFRTDNPDNINKYINDYSDESKSIDERIKKSVPLLLLSPLLSCDNCVKVFDSTVNITHKLIQERQEIPLDFIDILDEVMAEDMEFETLNELFKHIYQTIQTEKSAAAITVIAPLARYIVAISEEAFEQLIVTAIQAIQKDPLNQMAGCFLLEYFSIIFEGLPGAAPSDDTLSSLLIPLLYSENVPLRKRAYKSFKAMIQGDVFMSPQIVSQVLAEFSHFKNDEDLLTLFFKIITTFIYPDEDDDEDDEETDVHPSTGVIQPILDFTTTTLKEEGSSTLVRGHCLDCLADLAGRDQIFVEGCYMEALRMATAIIDGGERAAFPYVSAYLVAMTKCFRDETAPTVQAHLPPLMELIKSGEGITTKNRLNLAADISVIVGDGLADSLAQPLADFAKSFLSSENTKEMMSACAIFLGIRPKLSVAMANEVFRIGSERVKKVEDSHTLYILLQTMRKMVKKFDLSAPMVDGFVKDLIEGNLKILDGQQPHLARPPEQIIFTFLKTYVVRFPSKSGPICHELVDWIGTAQFSVIPALLEPVNAGLDAGVFSDEESKRLSYILLIFLSQLNQNDGDELSAAAETLCRILDANERALDPVDRFLNRIAEIVGETDDESIMCSSIIDSMPAVASFVFSVYAAIPDAPVNEDLLVKLTGLLPFDPDVPEGPEVFECLNSMLEEPDRFKCIVGPAMWAFTDVLLMKKSELEEYGFEQDLTKAMKETLKTIVKSDQSIEKFITAQLGNSRAKLNRFRALIR